MSASDTIVLIESMHLLIDRIEKLEQQISDQAKRIAALESA